MIFSLADIAFRAACNARGEAAVAVTVTITFLAPPALGSRLIATGRERRQGRRTGFYDVVVSTSAGVDVARLQCVTHRVPGAGSVDTERIG